METKQLNNELSVYIFDGKHFGEGQHNPAQSFAEWMNQLGFIQQTTLQQLLNTLQQGLQAQANTLQQQLTQLQAEANTLQEKANQFNTDLQAQANQLNTELQTTLNNLIIAPIDDIIPNANIQSMSTIKDGGQVCYVEQQKTFAYRYDNQYYNNWSNPTSNADQYLDTTRQHPLTHKLYSYRQQLYQIDHNQQLQPITITPQQLQQLQTNLQGQLANYATTQALQRLQTTIQQQLKSLATTQALQQLQTALQKQLADYATNPSLEQLKATLLEELTHYATTQEVEQLQQLQQGKGEEANAFDTLLDLSQIYGKQLGKDWKGFANLNDLNEALLKCATGKQDHTKRFNGNLKADVNGILVYIRQTPLNYKTQKHIQYLTGPITINFDPKRPLIFSDEVHTLYRIIEHGKVITEWTDPLSELYLASTIATGNAEKITQLETRIQQLEQKHT